jgi:glutathione S-transferase
MHAGFMAIRSAYGMDVRARGKTAVSTPELRSSIERLDQLWTACRSEFGAGGPWLCGEYCIADAMFAPMVLRFNTYTSDGLGEASRTYMKQTLSDLHLQSWMEEAAAEPWTLS